MFARSGVTAALTILICLLSSPAWGSLINGSFESGFSGWTIQGSGDTTATDAIPPPTSLVSPSDANTLSSLLGLPPGPDTDVNPTDGASFAYLTTAGDIITATRISQTFTLPAAASTLDFDWRFMTSEIDSGPLIDDAFQATLTPSIGIPLAFAFDRDALQPGGTGPLSPLATSGVGGYAAGTQWQTTSFSILPFAGQDVTLSFVVYDVGDSLGDSALAIDNVRTVAAATPEPGSTTLLLSGGLVLMARLRRRIRPTRNGRRTPSGYGTTLASAAATPTTHTD